MHSAKYASGLPTVRQEIEAKPLISLSAARSISTVFPSYFIPIFNSSPIDTSTLPALVRSPLRKVDRLDLQSKGVVSVRMKFGCKRF